VKECGLQGEGLSTHDLTQGWATLAFEIYFPVEFSSNPDQNNLPVTF